MVEKDYAKANKRSKAILALPSSKMLKIHTVFHTFFMGLIAFHTYRDGEGEDYLEKGKEALVKMEVWGNCSAANHTNKLLLLKAEHHVSMCNIDAISMQQRRYFRHRLELLVTMVSSTSKVSPIYII